MRWSRRNHPRGSSKRRKRPISVGVHDEFGKLRMAVVHDGRDANDVAVGRLEVDAAAQ